jgi:N-acetyl-anhydromuramyl-L-alanine amidase AmpD
VRARALLKRTRMMRPHVVGALMCALVGCSAPEANDALVDEVDPAVVTDLNRVFAAASAESGVPADLLAAIGYVETRWQMVQGEAEHDGQPAGVGVMAIRGRDIVDAADRAGVSVDDITYDALANIRGAALLLADEAAAQGVSGSDLLAWAPVIATWSDIEDADGVAQYVQGDVFGTLATGAEERAESGELVASIAPHPDLVQATQLTLPKGTADYPASVWRPSPNYGSRGGWHVSHVIIHTCEGNYAGCWGWLRNPAAQASAHYVVNANGSEITQLVREADRAWHVAASYKCSLNGNTDCAKNGVSVNNFAVGIEHAGFASQATWNSSMIDASAKLTCDITKSHGIPRDRHHILGHGQLQPGNRTDPGAHWPWTLYMDRVRAHCGDGGGGGGTTPPPSAGSIIVDSNNANNDTAKAKIELTGAWTSASATPGFYGSGYYFGATDEVSAPATFWFYLSSAQSRTVDAWWTAGPNRSTAAAFVAYNAAGAEVGRSTKNQTAGGGSWQQLGTYAFTAGWNKIVLSRWAAPGKVVIADAVRIR